MIVRPHNPASTCEISRAYYRHLREGNKGIIRPATSGNLCLILAPGLYHSILPRAVIKHTNSQSYEV